MTHVYYARYGDTHTLHTATCRSPIALKLCLNVISHRKEKKCCYLTLTEKDGRNSIICHQVRWHGDAFVCVWVCDRLLFIIHMYMLYLAMAEPRINQIPKFHSLLLISGWMRSGREREGGNNKIKYRPEATVVSWTCIFMVFHDKLGFWVTSGLFHIHHKQQLCRRGASKADWRAGQSRQSRRAEDDSRKCQRCCWSSLEVKLFIQLGRNGGECASLHSPKHIIIVSCRSISPQLLTNRTPLLLEPPQRVFI